MNFKKGGWLSFSCIVDFGACDIDYRKYHSASCLNHKFIFSNKQNRWVKKHVDWVWDQTIWTLFCSCIRWDWLLQETLWNLWPLMLCRWLFFNNLCMAVTIEDLIVKLNFFLDKYYFIKWILLHVQMTQLKNHKKYCVQKYRDSKNSGIEFAMCKSPWTRPIK